jgi:phage tail-like protein
MRTPRIREVRIEQKSHSLVRRLPAVFTADDEQAAFLHGYLSTVDGILHDLDVRSRCRDILVDPHATPMEALDWLASFVGLVLDERWAEAARRQLVAEIVQLFRLRGTVWALSRYIEIFLAGDRATEPGHVGVAPVIIEHFRLRGVGGPMLGDDPAMSSRSVVGAGFRVGGAVGDLGAPPLGPDDAETSPFSSHAHRFTVLIPRSLGSDEEAAIRHVLDTERPAHTTFEMCTVDAGMRAGRGLHLGISSIVGPTGAFEHAIVDRSLLGRRSILGPPSGGIAVEAARVGTTARVG